MASIALIVSILSCLISTALGLSCYSCNKEGWNWGSCTTTFVKCEAFQDACTSYVSYHLPLRYNPRGERYHSISKGCDTQQGCARRQDALDQSTCSRTSYADWSCVECCVGDLCNYYITLGSGAVHASVITTLLAIAAQCVFRVFRNL